MAGFAALAYCAPPMRLSDFHFELPPELIAKYPVTPRDTSRLLTLSRSDGGTDHHVFHELPNLLKPNDLLVFNDTKVIPARLFAKTRYGGTIEVLLLAPSAQANQWSCLVRPGKKVRDGLTVMFGDESLGHITRAGDDFIIECDMLADAIGRFAWIEKNGVMPLPPYLNREAESSDTETYQTVYAKTHGSIAAPTAGLHFTEELLKTIKAAGVNSAFLTLHVGYGTFAPIATDEVDHHVMHNEFYEIPPTTLAQIETARALGGRVVAVGTTTLRALESYPQFGPRAGTQIFIKPGHAFSLVDGLITNFHLPESTLLILVSAFAGKERILSAYQEAVKRKYRFFSYGDAMLIL